MTNDHGTRVRFLSYGGVITEIDVPDRTGHLDNIALGLRSLRDYETLPGHFGAITGRYANRIGGAQFTLDGQTYHLIANNGPNTLHGGPDAFDHRLWTVSPLTLPDGVAAIAQLCQPGRRSELSGDADRSGRTITLGKIGAVNCGNCLTIIIRAATSFKGGRGRLEFRQLGASTWD